MLERDSLLQIKVYLLFPQDSDPCPPSLGVHTAVLSLQHLNKSIWENQTPSKTLGAPPEGGEAFTKVSD